MSNEISEKKLKYMEYVHREEMIRHHTNSEEMYQYELLRAGDMQAVEEAKKMFSSNLTGHISEDRLRNYKYLFVASITLACRSAIYGGMDSERAFNISDLYILKMDGLQTVEEVKALHGDMFEFYTREMAALDKERVYSKPVVVCIDYIYNHLHEPIRTGDLAELVHMSRSYVSTVFKKETGSTVTEYVLSKRLEAARNMLRFSDYSYADISATLAFSSQSHFIRVFKENTGLTPREYRNKYYSGQDVK